MVPACAGFAVAIADAHSFGCLADLFHGGFESNDTGEAGLKGCGDLVHSAHRLEHGGLHVVHVFEKHAFPETGVEQRVHVERIARHPQLIRSARMRFVTRSRRALIKIVWREIAVLAQKLQHAFFVFFGQIFVEGLFVQRLWPEAPRRARGYRSSPGVARPACRR